MSIGMYTVFPSVSIKAAMKKITEGGKRCLVVVDGNNILQGTLSDGDLRKAIVSGVGIERDIRDFYFSSASYLVAGEYKESHARAMFEQEGFALIPIINRDKQVIDVLFPDGVLPEYAEEKNPALVKPVVIMAGGKGTRLEPFTTILPKPLIPVHDKPIVEHIIERFTQVGCIEFYLTLNYKGKILRSYFDELDPTYNIRFVEEYQPLGTAGSLRLLKGQIEESFFVTNCDIIVKTDYRKLYSFHVEGDYSITLVASAKEYVIPYGVCELTEEGELEQINEKPRYELLINTGLYVINPEWLHLIPKDCAYHMTQLIKEIKKQGGRIGVFHIGEDSWVDVGEWPEYQRTLSRLL